MSNRKDKKLELNSETVRRLKTGETLPNDPKTLPDPVCKRIYTIWMKCNTWNQDE